MGVWLAWLGPLVFWEVIASYYMTGNVFEFPGKFIQFRCDSFSKFFALPEASHIL